MSDTPETLDAILAEMKRRADEANDGLNGVADINQIDYMEVEDWVSRIKAAAKREASAPGNTSAMRAALEEIYNEAQNICDYCDEQRIVSHRADKIEGIVNTALASPARNADRFATAEEAVAAFADHLRAWENAHGVCSEYPDHPVQVPAGAFAWLFAPAKEEGGDHD